MYKSINDVEDLNIVASYAQLVADSQHNSRSDVPLMLNVLASVRYYVNVRLFYSPISERDFNVLMVESGNYA